MLNSNKVPKANRSLEIFQTSDTQVYLNNGILYTGAQMLRKTCEYQL